MQNGFKAINEKINRIKIDVDGKKKAEEENEKNKKFL